MVQLVNSGSVKQDSESWKLPVKLEVEDPLDEKHGPLNKRSKFSAQCDQPLITGENKTMPDMALYNPLNEPSPLGLQLRKTPSLVDLIQMRLSQANAAEIDAMNGEHLQLGKKKDAKCTAVSATTEKLKASNFPASLLRIGTWECVSRYEGDLVAKCYFAKHKLVWEVLEGGLKSKIEIQWSDITDLKATCPENGPGTMVVVLARPPLFFRETNPQPRKHTLWHATLDFTCGQASIHRRHLLQCPQGLLNKHFEKLIQCDPRLNLLSQQPEMPLDSPYFESRLSVLAEQDEAKGLGFNLMKTEYIPTFSSFRDSPSPCAAQSSSAIEMQDPVSRVLEAMSHQTPSPSSVMDARAIEDNGSSETEEFKEPKQTERFKVPVLHPSMPMTDLISHIGHCISEQMTSGNGENREVLDEIAQYLLSDSQFTSASDEQSLMKKVNSLCCLLQNPKDEGGLGVEKGRNSGQLSSVTAGKPTCEDVQASSEGDSKNELPAIPRKDSLGDLLLHLPRIASLPQFLFNISEKSDSEAR